MILYPTNITPWRHILILSCVQVPTDMSRYLLNAFPGSFVQVPPAHVSRFFQVPPVHLRELAWLIYAFPDSYVQVPPVHFLRFLCLGTSCPCFQLPMPIVQVPNALVSRFLCPGNSCPCLRFLNQISPAHVSRSPMSS